MIGQLIQSRRSFPWGALLFLLSAIPLLVAAVVERNPHFAVGACLPLFIATLLVLRPLPSVRFEFTETEIDVHNPPQSIPYETIESVVAPKRPGDPDKAGPRHYAMSVIHEAGTLHLPAKLNVPSDDVFDFLLATFPASGSPQVNPLVRGYLKEQTETFGADRVWSCRARTNLGKPAPNRGLAVCLAVLGTGIVWLGVGGVAKESGWLVGGLLLVMFGGLFTLLFWLVSRRYQPRSIRHWKQASLVISPVGLALVQGDLKGEMRWDELRDLKFKRDSGFDTSHHHTAGRGILLSFEGAQVMILDIYDRPLNLIYKHIHDYWRGP